MTVPDETPASVCGYRIRETAPPLFRFAKRMIRAKIRGGHRLLRLASRGVVQYDLGNSYKLAVPIFREDHHWDRDDILDYEHELLGEMGRAAQGMRDATLVDCGADIGMFSVRLCRLAPNIRRVVAFEPNSEVLPFLYRNLSQLPHPALMIGHAVGNLNGTGSLQRPPEDHSDHARYLKTDPDGSIRVISLDSLNLSGEIILKIDVEGGELAVLEGAVETIRQAPRCLLSFEAHSWVANRTGRDPVEILRFLNSIRPFRFVVTTTSGTFEIQSLDQPLFKPGLPKTIWDIVASTGS